MMLLCHNSHRNIDAINEEGGWPEGPTIKDLDLAIRATLKGWKFLYLGSFKRVALWKKRLGPRFCLKNQGREVGQDGEEGSVERTPTGKPREIHRRPATKCNGNRQDQFPPGNLFVSVSEGLWDNGAACGRRYRLKCLSGTKRPCKGGTVDVKVVDFCSKRPCPSTIVMSKSAFSAISHSPKAKINVEYIQI
ncbi:hypothetical protein RJ640_021145 [Escallonia rubra]|uniref:Expansin-like EG45 domain-containing protein n=1 Tax=Escallonia rubra TaxID=112253 RepID=A0AA88R6R5_9ASTE|nr:hypothetical protein RJ640_021145 [Escallonia rubra]